ncbi:MULTISPECIES: permease-like cell division protein FtsX [Corynebacterium]|uniref:Cell division protein FtsX n=1 Tax=Corynebacterium flavescens TaxID=28028 RepID=A0A1L7CKN3_CORFL|nr:MULTISPECIES: permease-like cell division protein FtsX [Corynebacterium]APT86385.1 cell division protein FtsX [Corynebacterium flavescens]KAA8723865.1 ABC transporter permease [Corynebacterium flavescens]MDN6100551.1 permease-like cell division protein FtsX [Corynebacterium flavescens]MDN6198990.1 permease-like cell division protein FtsX [Corynebacterium flavescens]MDN6225955.1 permease-like cell division protein FtsX [Corynebacterium flavescens]
MHLGYVLREAFKGLGRNLTMTIAMIITTAISVGLVVAGILVTDMTKNTKEIYLERVEVMVQLDEDISANDPECTTPACADLKEELETNSEIDSVEYRNRQASYDRFVELFEDTDPVMVQETSPDALPAAFHVRLKDPTNTEALAAIADDPAVSEIVDQQEEVRGAASNLDSIRNATFILAAIMAIAAVFLIANMVQIAAFNRARETSIMRMVGASRWFTQAPFVLEAVLGAFIGVVLAGAGVLVGKKTVLDPSLENLYQSQLLAPINTGDIWVALPIVGLIALIFAGLTALVTMRAYVRK